MIPQPERNRNQKYACSPDLPGRVVKNRFLIVYDTYTETLKLHPKLNLITHSRTVTRENIRKKSVIELEIYSNEKPHNSTDEMKDSKKNEIMKEILKAF